MGWSYKKKGLVPLEIMVHPTLAPDGTITDYKGGESMQEVFDKFGHRGRLLSYRYSSGEHRGEVRF